MYVLICGRNEMFRGAISGPTALKDGPTNGQADIAILNKWLLCKNGYAQSILSWQKFRKNVEMYLVEFEYFNLQTRWQGGGDAPNLAIKEGIPWNGNSKMFLQEQIRFYGVGIILLFYIFELKKSFWMESYLNI